MPDDDDAVGGVVDTGLVEYHLYLGESVGGGDGDTAEPQGVVMFFGDAAGEYHLLTAVDAVVGGVVAAGGGGIREEHATRSHEVGIGGQEVAADGVAEGAGLDMGAADMDDVEVAAAGGGETLPAGEE